MNLRDLKYFLALAETRHFGQAAARHFVSQPTLSGQIRKLEEELGGALFERSKKSVVITPLGALLLPCARRAVAEVDALVQCADASRDPLAGPLRLGMILTLAPYLVPLVLVPFKRRYPQMPWVLTEELTDRLLARLRGHELDCVLLATSVDDPELIARPLFDEPFWLALPPKHPLIKKKLIATSDLRQLDLLLLAEGHCLADQAMDLCGMHERPQSGGQADLRAASLETLLQLVAAGSGATLVPALALLHGVRAGSGVTVRPLPDASRRVSLVWRRSFPRPAAIEALAGIVVESLPKTVRCLEQT